MTVVHTCARCNQPIHQGPGELMERHEGGGWFHATCSASDAALTVQHQKEGFIERVSRRSAARAYKTKRVLKLFRGVRWLRRKKRFAAIREEKDRRREERAASRNKQRGVSQWSRADKHAVPSDITESHLLIEIGLETEPVEQIFSKTEIDAIHSGDDLYPRSVHHQE